MSNKMKKIIGVVVVVALITTLALVWWNFRDKPVEGSKSISIEVVDDKGSSTVYSVNTDAEYLQQAMEEAEGLEFSGTDSEYGLAVDTVNGLRADYTLDSAYWAFYVNGEYCNYGISQQPVNDKDEFKIEYTLGF